MDRGALYVALGEQSRREACLSIRTLQGHCPSLPIALIGDQPILMDNLLWIEFNGDPGRGARRAKLSMDLQSPFEYTLYLDADTRIMQSPFFGFQMLQAGWDMVIAHSPRQGYDVLGNVQEGERWQTLDEIACPEPLGLQGGLIFFRRCEAVEKLFRVWREEWERFQDQYQGALLRALWQEPVRLWILGHPWNSERGEVINHLFGRARI